MEQLDLHLRLITILTKEMETEILINEDSSEFWKKANEIVFEQSLPSFREGLTNLQEILGSDKDAYNYFSSMVARIMSDPNTRPALKQFVEGFDVTVSDPVLGNGFNFKASELTPISQLILYISVHRNLITLAMFAQEQAEKNKATNNKKGQR